MKRLLPILLLVFSVGVGAPNTLQMANATSERTILPIPTDPSWEIGFQRGTFNPSTFNGQASNVVLFYRGKSVIKLKSLRISSNGVPESTSFFINHLYAEGISTFDGILVAGELVIKDTGVGVLLDAFHAINKQGGDHLFSRNIRFFFDLVTIGAIQVKALTIQHEEEYLQVDRISASEIKDGMLGRFLVETVRGVGDGGVVYRMERLELKNLPFSSAARKIKSYQNVYCRVAGVFVDSPDLNVNLGALTVGPPVSRGRNFRFSVDLRQLGISPGDSTNAEIRALFREVKHRRVTLDSNINLEINKKAKRAVASLSGTGDGGTMADIDFLVEVGIWKQTFDRLFDEFLPAVIDASLKKDEMSAFVKELLVRSEFRKAKISLDNRELVDVLFAIAAQNERVSERELRMEARAAVKKANQETRGLRVSEENINSFLSQPGKLVVSLEPKQPISFDLVAIAGKTPSLLRYMLNVDIRFTPNPDAIVRSERRESPSGLGLIATKVPESVPLIEKGEVSSETKPSDSVWKSNADSSQKIGVNTLPSNGDISVYVAGDRQGPLEIKTEKGAHFLIKLVRSGMSTAAVEIFVHEESVIKVYVPLGVYELRYANGQQWYGRERLFGPDTGYFKADKPFDFKMIGNRVRGYKIKLYPVKHGNLRTTPIDPKSF